MEVLYFKKAIYGLLMIACSVLTFNPVCNASEELYPNQENIKEITISFAGDCTLGEYKGQGTGNQFKDYFDNFGADYFFENVRPIFKNDDITFINLEGPLTTHKQTAIKKFPIKGDVRNVDILAGSSVEICNLANNHTYDCGQVGYYDTVNLLKENNIGYCSDNSVYRKTINDVQISFLGYNGWDMTSQLIENISSSINIEKQMGSDIICVMFHWGEERKNYSNSTQEAIAHATIDAGADIVVGCHPHVIQGIEKYNDKTIVYSLGNFSFGANKNPKDKDTFIFQQTFLVDENGIVSYGDENIIACSISSVDNKNDYKPTPLTGEKAIHVIYRLKEYSNKYENTLDVLK